MEEAPSLDFELIGRASDRALLQELFAQGARLVTLTGSAGVGKSSLARLWCGDGVFVELDSARSQSDIEDALLRQLEAAPGPRSVARLPEILRGWGDLRLVVDGFEHLTRYASQTVEAWAEASPSVQIVVTSQHLLRCEGEHEMRLEPLPTGSADSPSVRLLVARAQQVDPTFRTTPENQEALSRIAQRLDGLPLALELVAAPLTLFGAEATLRSIAKRGALSGNASAALLESLAESWELLSSDERQTLAQCSVFSGAFDLEAAEQVVRCGESAVSDLLRSLHRKSLLAAVAGGRWRLLSSIRHYAFDKLSDVDPPQQRFVQYYVDLAQQAAKAVVSEDFATAWRRLRLERDNIGAAVDRSLDGDLAARALLSLRDLLLADGATAKDLERMQRVEPKDPRLLAALQALRGYCLYAAGEIEAAAAEWEAGRVNASRCHDEQIELQCIRGDGLLHRLRGDVCRAEDILELEALPMAQACGAMLEEGRALLQLLSARTALGRVEGMRESFVKMIERLRTAGGHRDAILAHAYYGHWLSNTGHYDEAFEQIRIAAELRSQVGTIRDDVYVEGYRGLACLGAGRYEEATEALNQTRDLCTKTGSAVYGAAAGGWASVARLLSHGDFAASFGEFRDTVHRVEQSGDGRHLAIFGALAARCAFANHQFGKAFRYLRLAQQSAETLSDESLLQIVALQCADLEPDRFARASKQAGSEDAASTLELRVALRLSPASEWGKSMAKPFAQPAGQLVFDSRFGRLWNPGAEEVTDLSSRDVLMRLLRALMDASHRQPGVSVSSAELAASVWGDGEDAGAENRIRVSVSRLRQLGLRDAIESRNSGYLLTQAVDVVDLEDFRLS